MQVITKYKNILNVIFIKDHTFLEKFHLHAEKEVKELKTLPKCPKNV